MNLQAGNISFGELHVDTSIAGSPADEIIDYGSKRIFTAESLVKGLILCRGGGREHETQAQRGDNRSHLQHYTFLLSLSVSKVALGATLDVDQQKQIQVINEKSTLSAWPNRITWLLYLL